MPKRYLIVIFLLAAVLFAGLSIYAAPVANVLRSVLIDADNQYYLGTTTPSRLSYVDIFTRNLTVISGTATTTISTGVSTLAGGFISQASSTVAGNFTITGNLGASGRRVPEGWFDALDTLTLRIANTASGDMTVGGDLSVNGGDINLGTGSATSTLTSASGRFGIGTTTPGLFFSAKGPFLVNSTSTIEGGGLVTQAISATGTLGFYTAGAAAPRMLIDSSGNVGVGTSSPSSRLSVSGSSGLFVTNTGTGYTAYIEDIADDTSPFVITDVGRVGIGAIPTVGKLLVEGSTQIRNTDVGIASGLELSNDTAQAVDTGIRLRFSSGGNTLSDVVSSWESGSGNSYLSFSTRLNANIERMRIISSGNVGIGTTSPGALLAMKGPFLANSTSTIEGGGLITQALAATGTLGFYTGSAAVPRMVIDSSGNVGIGTTSPAQELSVVGDIYNSSAATTTITVFSTSSTQAGCIEFEQPATAGGWTRMYAGRGGGTNIFNGVLVIEEGRCQ